jgi:hypothetical protein
MHSKTRLNNQSTAQATTVQDLFLMDSPSWMRELDGRMVNGLEVQLLWDSDTGCIWVSVCDARTGNRFLIEVRDGERPMDVFHHPFAYAPREQLEAVLAGPAPTVHRITE